MNNKRNLEIWYNSLDGLRALENSKLFDWISINMLSQELNSQLLFTIKVI